MMWQGYLKYQTGGGENWSELRQHYTRHYPSFGESVEELEDFMKTLDIHPDQILIFKVWLVGRNKKISVTHCNQVKV